MSEITYSCLRTSSDMSDSKSKIQAVIYKLATFTAIHAAAEGAICTGELLSIRAEKKRLTALRNQIS
jgi:hypothetical protein